MGGMTLDGVKSVGSIVGSSTTTVPLFADPILNSTGVAINGAL